MYPRREEMSQVKNHCSIIKIRLQKAFRIQVIAMNSSLHSTEWPCMSLIKNCNNLKQEFILSCCLECATVCICMCQHGVLNKFKTSLTVMISF
jgi:hypothetical protein